MRHKRIYLRLLETMAGQSSLLLAANEPDLQPRQENFSKDLPEDLLEELKAGCNVDHVNGQGWKALCHPLPPNI